MIEQSTIRQKPHNPEAEQTFLGSILLSREAFDESVAAHPAIADYFFDFRHRAIFEAVAEAGCTDLFVLREILTKNGNFERVGGFPVIMSLQGMAIGAPEEARHAAEILKGHYVKRRLIEVAYRASEAGYNDPAFEALEKSEKAILEIGSSMSGEADVAVRDGIKAVLGEMEDAFNNKGKIRGISTGFHDFDWKTYGLKPGQMIVVAARPGVGKTSLAMNIAEHVAVDKKIPVGVFSLEMSTTELLHRMACSRARIDSEAAQSGDLKELDFSRLTSAASQIANAPLHICERGGLTISQLSARARRMAQRHKVKLLVIDYLQLMQSRSKENRTSQITEISNGVKALAKDLKIPIIILSQLSREVEKEGRSPRMSDLRESGAIEQDADIIMLLNPIIGKDGIVPDVQEVDALIPKVRGGRVGMIKLWFNRPLTRFENVANESRTSEMPTPAHWND